MAMCTRIIYSAYHVTLLVRYVTGNIMLRTRIIFYKHRGKWRTSLQISKLDSRCLKLVLNFPKKIVGAYFSKVSQVEKSDSFFPFLKKAMALP